MHRTISATEARRHLGELMTNVAERGEAVIVERTGKPQAIFLSVEEYKRLCAGGPPEEDWWAQAERVREHIAQHHGDKPMPSVDDIIHEMREERDAQLLANLLPPSGSSKGDLSCNEL